MVTSLCTWPLLTQPVATQTSHTAGILIWVQTVALGHSRSSPKVSGLIRRTALELSLLRIDEGVRLSSYHSLLCSAGPEVAVSQESISGRCSQAKSV